MPLTLDLPAELIATLSEEASRLGLSLPAYAARLLAERLAPPAVRTGADLVAYWEAQGLIGNRPDIADSQEHARSLRAQAQQRGE